jgi:hypothetical protein
MRGRTPPPHPPTAPARPGVRAQVQQTTAAGPGAAQPAAQAPEPPAAGVPTWQDVATAAAWVAQLAAACYAGEPCPPLPPLSCEGGTPTGP